MGSSLAKGIYWNLKWQVGVSPARRSFYLQPLYYNTGTELTAVGVPLTLIIAVIIDLVTIGEACLKTTCSASIVQDFIVWKCAGWKPALLKSFCFVNVYRLRRNPESIEISVTTITYVKIFQTPSRQREAGGGVNILRSGFVLETFF